MKYETKKGNEEESDTEIIYENIPSSSMGFPDTIDRAFIYSDE